MVLWFTRLEILIKSPGSFRFISISSYYPINEARNPSVRQCLNANIPQCLKQTRKVVGVWSQVPRSPTPGDALYFARIVIHFLDRGSKIRAFVCFVHRAVQTKECNYLFYQGGYNKMKGLRLCSFIRLDFSSGSDANRKTLLQFSLDQHSFHYKKVIFIIVL